jgi:hypothetical protein
MSPEERIGVLCAQLLRATNPEVVQIVADELKDAVDAYATSVQQDFPVIDISALACETAS